MNKITVCDVEKKGSHGRLNLMNINYTTKSGKEKTWNLVSRKNEEDFKEALYDKTKLKADGVVIYATHKETGKLVVLKEFRVAANSDIITFPAGLVDEKETYEETAKREFFEETGMKLTFIDTTRSLKPRYSAIGLTDEAIVIVYGICEGEPTEMKGDNEQGSVIMLSPEDAENILDSDEYIIAGRTALMLELYLAKM